MRDNIESIEKKEYILKGLCCPVCASKIENGIRELRGVSNADIDFTSGRLFMKIDGAQDVGAVLGQTRDIVKRYEPETEMVELSVYRKDESRDVGFSKKVSRVTLLLGALLFISGFFLELEYPVKQCFFIAVYLIAGGEILLKAARNISRGQVFDENFLMTAASIGAFALREYHEGIAVMIFYRIGKAFEDFAVDKSRRSVSALIGIMPDFANLKTEGGFVKVSPHDVAPGSLAGVKPGEKIPLDGIVEEGYSVLDTSALTGESAFREVGPGSEVLSGSINKNGFLLIRVIRESYNSAVFKILDLVENAGARKAPVENFITKFARYYTPAVILSAVLLSVVPPLVTGAPFFDWIERGLVFLVVSCPCALVISVPLSFFGGIGSASRKGILIKGSNYLEALNDVDTVVFDKTGTLTRGIFEVAKIEPTEGFSEEELLYLAACAEKNSNHPIAVSILKAYGKNISDEIISNYEEFSGYGVRVVAGGKKLIAGNNSFMAANGIICPVSDSIGTLVHIASDGVYAGHLIISDKVKPDSKRAIAGLKSLGVRRVVMLTGDNRLVAETIAAELGLDAVYSELLPHQKVEKMEELDAVKPAGKYNIFAGDGINDAPVLARSDVGVAMGAGSDAAIEAADIVLVKDEPYGIVSAISIAMKTKRIVTQNIVFALGVKAVILTLGACGAANLWLAVFGDVGVTFIAILNAMRMLRPGSDPAGAS